MIAEQQIPTFVRRLMPTASEEELRDATDTFLQYMAIVRRIYDRVSEERTAVDSSEKEIQDTIGNASQSV